MAERGCSCRCWCSCRWISGLAITNNFAYASCYNAFTLTCWLLVLPPIQNHPHKYTTMAERGCSCRCWCSCRWISGQAITNNFAYASCYNAFTLTCWLLVLPPCKAIRTNTQQRRREGVLTVVGVRAVGLAASQSPTTLLTLHVIMLSLLLVGCWCCRPAKPSAQIHNNGGERVFVPLDLWPGNHQQLCLRFML